jgi:hypothetical protein
MIRYYRWARVRAIAQDTHKGIARCPRVGKCVSTFAQQKKMPDLQGGFHLVYQNTDGTNKFKLLGENTILTIACEAVGERRQVALKLGEQVLIDGTVQEAGYTIYADYRRYMEERKLREGLELHGWDFMRVRHKIKETLLLKGWEVRTVGRETRFYPLTKDRDKQPPTLL